MTVSLIFDKISRLGQKNARSSLPPFLFLRISLIRSFIDLSLHNPNLTLNQAPQNPRLRWGGNCIDCSNTEQSLPVTLCNYPQCRQSAFTEEKYQHQLEYPYHPLRYQYKLPKEQMQLAKALKILLKYLQCTMRLSPLKSCIKEFWLNASLSPHFPSV